MSVLTHATKLEVGEIGETNRLSLPILCRPNTPEARNEALHFLANAGLVGAEHVEIMYDSIYVRLANPLITPNLVASGIAHAMHPATHPFPAYRFRAQKWEERCTNGTLTVATNRRFTMEEQAFVEDNLGQLSSVVGTTFGEAGHNVYVQYNLPPLGWVDKAVVSDDKQRVVGLTHWAISALTDVSLNGCEQ